MNRIQSHDDDAYGRKRLKTCENGGVAPWSELNHDVLFLVMMRLGFVDFPAFSRVCKSWRSLALTNKNMFITSRPPMSISFSFHDAKEKECYLKDLEEREFKTILPHSGGRLCLGLTCGYLILYGEETNDFWLVNPITRHQLHFPVFRRFLISHLFKGILVFSQLINGWVFVTINRFDNEIWFCILDEGTWNHLSSDFDILDLHAFKGKIYTLHAGCHLCELRLNPKPKLTSLEIKYVGNQCFSRPNFVSSGDNLFVISRIPFEPYYVQELDFGEMKWVFPDKKTLEEYIFFIGLSKNSAAIKPKATINRLSQYGGYASFVHQTAKIIPASMWYFLHECMNVNVIDEDRLFSLS